jgi:hypothetical protein
MDQSTLGLVQQSLSGPDLQRIAQQIGADEQTTRRAIDVALPMLLGGLANNAQTKDGATALHGALEKHDGGILGNLGQLLSSPQAFGGASILGHILGGKQGAVQNGVARASGLDGKKVALLLMVLAPIVLGALGRRRREQQLDPGKLGAELQNEKQQVQQRPGFGGLLGMLDRDNDGNVADDVIEMLSRGMRPT